MSSATRVERWAPCPICPTAPAKPTAPCWIPCTQGYVPYAVYVRWVMDGKPKTRLPFND